MASVIDVKTLDKHKTVHLIKGLLESIILTHLFLTEGAEQNEKQNGIGDMDYTEALIT